MWQYKYTHTQSRIQTCETRNRLMIRASKHVLENFQEAFIRVNIRVDWIRCRKMKMKKQFKERITMMRIIIMIRPSLSLFEISSSPFLCLLHWEMNISSLQDLWEFFLNLKKWNFLKLIWIFFGKLFKVLIYTSNKYIH